MDLHNRLHLYSSSPTHPADQGFALVGQHKADPSRLVRVWVRRKALGERRVWSRLQDPRPASREWEVRVHEERATGAMTRVDFYEPRGRDFIRVEFHISGLDRLEQEFAFPQQPPGVEALQLSSVSDPLYKTARDWALKVTGSQAQPAMIEEWPAPEEAQP
jgi:hypothetical protein